MRLSLHEVELPLLHPFTISRGSTVVQSALIVTLAEGSVCGYGEASACSYYGMEIPAMRAALESVREDVERHSLGDPAQLWEQLDGRLGHLRFAQCALDIAAHDLWGKQLGSPLWQLWGLQVERTCGSDYTIGIDTIDRMLAKLAEFPGWPAYKIKLGTPDDLQIVRELRRHTSVPLRVDANCGWTVERTLANAAELVGLGVELIEQPLAPDDWAGARRLFLESPLPIFADESCFEQRDVSRCAGNFHGINIKLQKCGGLTPARRMIDQARQLDLKVMIGCMNESTVDISAAAQLLPLVDYADLDGAALLSRDVAAGVSIVQGRAMFPATGGCGTRLLAAAV